jgi:DNA repair ATPase RecN
MPRISRRAKWIIAFVIVLVVGYGIALYWQSRNQVPSSFSNARSQGAIIAQNIVNLSNESKADLEKVNEFDAQGNYQQALSLTSDIVSKSQELRDQAVQLSNQIEEMTKSLSTITAFDARQAALEAISSRLALITQLINYSGDLSKLLETLQTRFNGKFVSNDEIQAAVNQINTDVNAINNFNTQANLAMDRFDALTK